MLEFIFFLCPKNPQNKENYDIKLKKKEKKRKEKKNITTRDSYNLQFRFFFFFGMKELNELNTVAEFT